MTTKEAVVNVCKNPKGQAIIIAYIVLEIGLVGYGIVIDNPTQSIFADTVAIDVLVLTAAGLGAIYFMTFDGYRNEKRWYFGLMRKLGTISAVSSGFAIIAYQFLDNIKIVELSLLIMAFTGIPAFIMYLASTGYYND